jgi:hypothetical protein
LVLSVERMLAARYITELHVTLWYKINCTVTVRDTDNCQNVDHGTGCTVYHSIYVTVKWNKNPSLIPTKDRALVTRLIKVNVSQYIVLDA